MRGMNNCLSPSSSSFPNTFPFIPASPTQAYKRQFSQFIKEGVTSDSLEKMYRDAHSAIRADPVRVAKPAKEVTVKRWTAKRLSIQQRKARVAEKKAAFIKQHGEAKAIDGDDDDDDEEEMED